MFPTVLFNIKFSDFFSLIYLNNLVILTEKNNCTNLFLHRNISRRQELLTIKKLFAKFCNEFYLFSNDISLSQQFLAAENVYITISLKTIFHKEHQTLLLPTVWSASIILWRKSQNIKCGKMTGICHLSTRISDKREWRIEIALIKIWPLEANLLE